MGHHVEVTLDERQLKQLLAVALVLVLAGVWAFVLRGADGPADPSIGEAVDGGETPPTTHPGEPGRVLLEGFEEVAVNVAPGDGSFLAWCLLAALSDQQRGRGLMEVTDLQGYPGMAFVYQEDVQNGYHMTNTPMPLSIAWIAADGSVVTIADMAPCEADDDCPGYEAAGPYRYAIEAPQGTLDDLGITESSRVTVGGACAPT